MLRKEALSVLIEDLLPTCKVTTPNASEAGALAGMEVKTLKMQRSQPEKSRTWVPKLSLSLEGTWMPRT